jgi:hypothetical protein
MEIKINTDIKSWLNVKKGNTYAVLSHGINAQGDRFFRVMNDKNREADIPYWACNIVKNR